MHPLFFKPNTKFSLAREYICDYIACLQLNFEICKHLAESVNLSTGSFNGKRHCGTANYMIKNQFGDVIFEEQFLRINYLIFSKMFFLHLAKWSIVNVDKYFTMAKDIYEIMVNSNITFRHHYQISLLTLIELERFNFSYFYPWNRS